MEDPILSKDLLVAIPAYLEAMGSDIKWNEFHLLSEARDEIERLRELNEAKE